MKNREKIGVWQAVVLLVSFWLSAWILPVQAQLPSAPGASFSAGGLPPAPCNINLCRLKLHGCPAENVVCGAGQSCFCNAQCASDAACGGGQICAYGYCHAVQCTSPPDCPSGYACGAAGICERKREPVVAAPAAAPVLAPAATTPATVSATPSAAPTGQCRMDADCDDHDVCNGTERCDVAKGMCMPGQRLSCATTFCEASKYCDAERGCVSVGKTPCDDGNSKTVDQCAPTDEAPHFSCQHTRPGDEQSLIQLNKREPLSQTAPRVDLSSPAAQTTSGL